MSLPIKELIAQLMSPESDEGYPYNALLESFQLSLKLQECGPAVVEPVLNNLEKLHGYSWEHSAKAQALCNLVRAATPYFTSEHAERLAQMLNWPEVARNRDQSGAMLLLKALAPIVSAAGGHKVMEEVSDYMHQARRFEAVHDSSSFIGWPKGLALQVFRACGGKERKKEEA